MEIVRHNVEIEISTEENEDTISAFIRRPDKFSSRYYEGISPASVNRLRALVSRLKDSGVQVVGDQGKGNNYFAMLVLLQVRRDQSMIQINEEFVHYLADSFLKLNQASNLPEQITPIVRASDEAALRAFFWTSAICHSTKGGVVGKFGNKTYKGWDYLLRSFCSAAEDNEAIVSPEYIKTISGDKILDILTQYACEANVNLSGVDRRAEILNQCAIQLKEKFSGSIEVLLEKAQHKVGHAHGAYAQLALLDAFKDPLKKKSSAFLMTVHFSGKWMITDHKNVYPMIDYHRMRVLCRTGCISIQDTNLIQMLVNQKPVPSHVEGEIRKAAAEVCTSIVKITGIPMFEFDVLLWAHARSCCRHFPICISGQLENDSFYNYVEKNFKGICEFQSWCSGFQDDTLRRVWEPVVKTEDY